ncbi:potassium channel subfamily K member 5-like [Sinocyclocheilus rhinocerous]|uniref:potassium channel subfamily K member 5-like n=1 Tax=Sinocyclocheilus rhinocerous TaxID=307959 RepID=UPI0007B8744C|nr:PREDICTED: potassium channel subfamily K member 5-like [Sinocyclocheilus rhinocerous]
MERNSNFPSNRGTELGGQRYFPKEKDKILKKYPCLKKADLDHILEVVSDAAGQGITITGDKTFNNWNWPNAVIFAATVITTIGVDPNADYPTLYRYFVEVWIYLGLAWLSLFFNWKVRMVVEAHKALKKHRKRRKLSLDELQRIKASHKTLHLPPTPNDVNIFSFLSKKKEDYNDLIKQIGVEKEGEDQCVGFITGSKNKAPNRSKSCSDSHSINGNYIISLDRSPRQKRHYSFSDRVNVALSKSKSYLLSQEECLLMNEMHGEGETDTDLDSIRMYENQLDKEAGEKHKCLEHGGCSDGRITWDSKSYQPLMFPNANITFIDEENLLNNNLENDDNDFMPKFSTADETDFKEEQGSESETSVFTTDGSDHGHSYEQLVEEYSKEDNTDI